jgi:hypothetical protein
MPRHCAAVVHITEPVEIRRTRHDRRIDIGILVRFGSAAMSGQSIITDIARNLFPAIINS